MNSLRDGTDDDNETRLEIDNELWEHYDEHSRVDNNEHANENDVE